MSNLLLRILTAIVLLAVFVLVLCVPALWPFMALTLLLIAAGGWEWSRLAGWPGWRAWASGALCAALGVAAFVALALFNWNDKLLLGSLLTANVLWVIGGTWLLWHGVARWPALPRWLRWGVGVVMLAVAWVALMVAIMAGRNFLLSVLALVWVADIGAYFCGRALGGKLTGGRKLAPAISPGKSWEGAVGGFICVVLVGAVWVRVDLAGPLRSSYPNSLYTILWQNGPVWFFAGLAFLTAMSIVGDLTESLVKRAAGVKDSSALLPGHGGVLDRIDALLPTLPLALTLAALASGIIAP